MVGDVHRGEDGTPPRDLAELLEKRREPIFRAWLEAVRRFESAQGVSEPALANHFPDVLDCLAAGLRAREPDGFVLDVWSRLHATDRLDVGFEIDEVAREYGILREVILLAWSEAARRPLDVDDVVRLSQLIDRAVIASVSSYSHARQRTLRALDEITSAALAGPDFEHVFERLIVALRESTPVIDSAALFLVEDGALVGRAAVGQAQAHSLGQRLALGEGIAGLAAVRREPVLSLETRHDPRVASASLKRERIGSAYAVPLFVDHEVAGVALVGSKTTAAFSGDDLVLIRAMVSRAASLLTLVRVQRERQRALEVVERSEARFRLLAGLSRRLAEHGADLAGALRTTSEQLAEHIGDLCTIRLLTKDGEYLELVAAHGRDPAPSNYLRFLEDEPPPRAHEGAWGELMRTGKALRLTYAAPEAELWKSTVHPTRRAFLEEEGLRSLLLVPLRARGRVLGALALLRFDGDEPYAVEDESLAEEIADRAALAVDNARLVEQLQESMRMREDIVAIVGHDLRNPLSAITMSAELMQRRPVDDEKHQRGVARILDSSRRANRMIRDLLDFTQARVQGIPVRPEPVDFHEVVSSVVDELRAGSPERRIELAIHGGGQGVWDADRLAQVVGNLVGNAMHHSPRGSPIDVVSEGGDDSVRLRVHNGGTPIPEQTRATLFQPFRRRSPSRQGLGLGLYITASIVEAHGGRIEVTSTAAEGTTFTVTLPKRPTETGER